jgi:maltooligosyltrehalose synthase
MPGWYRDIPVGQKTWEKLGGLLLPEGSPDRWNNVLTGETLFPSTINGKKQLPLSGAFRHFPVALLTGGDND